MSGGCINRGLCLELASGDRCFLKWHPQPPAGMYAAEADGLRALRAAAHGTDVRVPEVLAVCPDGGWLLMEFIASGTPAPDWGVRLARGLSTIHDAGASVDRFGWPRPNWIGSLPQPNDERLEWGTFWREARIVPQLERVRKEQLLSGDRAGDALLDRLVDLIEPGLADVRTPALLHGDLWSGNAFADGAGSPVLIDPAVYRGHGAVDLAMTELFGGFDRAFHERSRDLSGIGPAYDAWQRDLYQLYYLLVHVNLFGASYLPGTLRAAERVVAELS